MPTPNIPPIPRTQSLAQVIDAVNRALDVIRHLLTGNADWVNTQEAGLLQTWQDSDRDDIDSANPMELHIYIPPEAQKVHKALLRIKLSEFRSTSTGGAAGGTHQHTITLSNHTHSIPLEYSVFVRNTGVADGHVHTYLDYDVFPSYEVTGAGGGIETTSASSGNHVHANIYGVYKASMPSSPQVTIVINSIDRTSELSGPFNSDQDSLDVTNWIQKGQWNTIQIGCGPGVLVRVQATLFVQAFIRPVGRLELE